MRKDVYSKLDSFYYGGLAMSLLIAVYTIGFIHSQMVFGQTPAIAPMWAYISGTVSLAIAVSVRIIK